MRAALKALLLYLALLAALLPSLREEASNEAALPPLPAEAELSGGAGRGFCASEALLRSLGARSFRWVHRAGQREPLWRHRLALLCDDGSAEFVRLTVLAEGKPVFTTTYARKDDDVTARVAARLLPLEPAVAEAAVAAYLRNQADVARAGADLWRASRWHEAERALTTALENGWDERSQADLYFGLADAYAHLGKPRQAFWYALAYVGVSGKRAPEPWLKALRGAAGASSYGGGAEPQAQALARAWTQAAAARRWDEAFEALKGLSLAAPWADAYQTAVAGLYAKLGWTALADSWERRAALTRRLAADVELQRRLAAELR